MGHVEDSSYAPTTDLHAGGANSQATVGCLLAAEQTSSFNSSPDGRALNPLKLQAEIITFSQGAQTLLPICKGCNKQKPKCKVSLVTSGPDLVDVDLPFVLNNCMSLDSAYHSVLSGSFWNQILSFNVCVSACFGYFVCFDGSAICISPKFWTEIFNSWAEHRSGKQQQGPFT